MAHVIGALVPTKGAQFNSGKELTDYLKMYSRQEKEVFVVKNSSTIEYEKIKSKVSYEKLKDVDLKLKYVYVHYGCKFGGQPRSAATGERQSSTYKMECPAFIKVHLSKDGTQLEIVSVNLMHENHPHSKVFYEAIPENRRLSPTTKTEVQALLSLNANKKLVKNKLAREKNKFVTFKDLSNVKAQMKNDRENELPTFVQLLEEKHGCDVRVLRDENGNFKGLYFSNRDMRASMSAWPEIVFIDGTYTLFIMKFTLIVLLVEDCIGRGEIVGAAIIDSEDRQTLKWIAEMFKQENYEACKKIRCFMGDKDMTERSVLKEIFPGIPIYLCLFHTLKSFSRAMADKKMGFSNTAERQKILDLLQQLAYSTSEEEYEGYYKQLKANAPKAVLQYFDDNWDCMRAEWTSYNMIDGNLNNLTNNRLESINKQIKQVVDRNSSLCHFGERFFEFMQSQNQETDLKTAKQFLKRPITVFSSDDSEQEYSVYLTELAFREVQKELNKHRVINLEKCNEEIKECIITLKKSEIKASPTECECSFRQSMSLPCKHIFAVRKHFGMPLFDQSLCHERWTKDYAKKNLRSFRKSEPCDIEYQPTSRTTIHTTPRRSVRTATEKRKLLKRITDDLVDMGTKSCGARLDNRIAALHEIVSAWRQGFEVRVETVSTFPVPSDAIQASHEAPDFSCASNLNSELKTLRISDDVTTKINDIAMPSPMRIQGRPNGLNSTTTGFFPRKLAVRGFSSLAAEEKLRLVLSWLVSDSIVEPTINGNKKINISYVDHFTSTNLPDSVASDSVDIAELKDYFELDAFTHIEKTVNQKKKSGPWMCRICHLEIGIRKKRLECSHCLRSYDLKCAGLQRLPKKAWYCTNCLKQ